MRGREIPTKQMQTGRLSMHSSKTGNLASCIRDCVSKSLRESSSLANIFIEKLRIPTNNIIFYIKNLHGPKTKVLGEGLGHCCNFRSWALSWAQSTKNDKSTLTVFCRALCPRQMTHLSRDSTTWTTSQHGAHQLALVVWLQELGCEGCCAKLLNIFCMELSQKVLCEAIS